VKLTIDTLLTRYRAGETTPSQLARELLDRLAEPEQQPVWISRVGEQDLLAAAVQLDGVDRDLPLYGIPFAVKDNIDVAGMPTTAACPGFAYMPAQTAPVVQRLLDAGAMLIGKTNMDQFATGLVGTRSPYGACAAASDPTRVSGGSSSGSAVAVALGYVAFSLGTDTAGSVRVPAAFNGLVGAKPTRGLLSTRGVVPACASLDCLGVLANVVGDAALVLDVAAGFDPDDRWSRREPAFASPRRQRIGVPFAGQVEQEETAATLAWAQAIERARDRWEVVELDIEPLLQAAPLLYDAWIAERAADLGEHIEREPEGLDPIVAEIVLSAGEAKATELFRAQHRLQRLHRAAASIWQRVDALLLPTTALHPTLAEVRAQPVATNTRLGRFTNFVNLMDLCSLALPGPARADGLPFGVTLHAPAHHDRRLLELGGDWSATPVRVEFPGLVKLAVAGAHMSGMPLNERLTERGARLVGPAVTAPAYRMYALAGGGPIARPGLVRMVDGRGESLEIEVWELAPEALGEIVEEVPGPLAIGHVALLDGSEIAGFVCESIAVRDAIDITSYGGWRAYREAADVANAA
jgi:allophanate hydrolase